jgi:hypothetical protein
MTIEVFFCEKSKKLVRGVQVHRKELSNGMVQYTANCPSHPGEILKKMDLRHTLVSTATQMFTATEMMMPIVSLPANPGTVDEPSSMFWEVLTKSVMAQLPEKDRGNAAELVVLAWQNELTVEDKQTLLEQFAQTGTVQTGSTKRRNPEQVIDITPSRESGVVPMDKAALKKVKSDFLLLEQKIRQSEMYMMGLMNVLEDTDLDAAKEIDFDLFAVARIVGYDDYPKDLEKRAKYVKVLETALGPDAMSQIL